MCAAGEDSFGGAQILFCIDADGVRRSGGNVDVDAVIEEAQLLEALDLLKPGGRQRGEFLERSFAVGVNAEVLAVPGEPAPVAVEGDRRAGEVECAVVSGGDDFDGVGILDVLRRAANGESAHLDLRALEETQQRREVFGEEKGLVALDVQVNIRGDGLGDGVDAVGAAGAVGGSEDGRKATRLREGEHLFRVGGDEHLIEQRAGAGGAIDPGQHGLAGNFAQDLAGQAGGSEACGNDGEDAAKVSGQRYRSPQFSVKAGSCRIKWRII